MKRVLVGFDTSAGAATALRLASEIALVHGGSVDALHVEDERSLSYVPFSVALGAAVGVNAETSRPLPADEMVDALERVAVSSAKVRETFTKILEPKLSLLSDKLYRVPELRIERGRPWELLAAQAVTADYVLMGRVGEASGERDLVPGETSESLARAILAPLLLLTKNSVSAEAVLLAYDGSEPAQRVMRAIPGLVDALGVKKIVILTVGSREDGADALVESAALYLEQCQRSIVTEVRQGEVVETILAVANEYGASLVAAGAFGSKGMRHVLWGSATEALLDEQSVSLLLSR